LTGQFDFSTASDSFAEYILKKDGGAPSLIAATRVSGTWRNDSLEKALFDGIYPGVIPTYPGTTASYAIKNNRLGDLLNYAKVYLFTSHGLNSGVKGHNEIYHVIGDPTLEIWTSPPNVNCFTLQIFTGYLQIKLNSAPRNGIVTIIDRGKIIKTINVTGTLIRFPLRNLQLLTPSPARRPLRVCFTAPGYRYIEKKIMI